MTYNFEIKGGYFMIGVFLFIIGGVIIWEADLEDRNRLAQLYNYEVKIENREGKIILKGSPPEQGHSTAWLYVPEHVKISTDDTLVIRLKVNRNVLRIRYFVFMEDKKVYSLGIKYVDRNKSWKNIEIPLNTGKPFYSSNVPFNLVPNHKPSLFLFFENNTKGDFEVKIDFIKVKGKRREKR
jgi:hypothetical protein